ncbi:MAG: bifunctional glutamate N-acetyltransferase/amino-acid acetyltransferase ArgJ [Candidatus Lambdaproteobacteria bacterium]|nr:bifunctional glutamate N-acetyltransferase/amino-acid acetyltransferase ArgJ [Candidatus Lambdaproteobacteria bacterium]
MPVPGFSAMGINIGIKDTRLDFGVVSAQAPCAAAGVFTRNNFPGAPVLVGREHIAGGRLQAIVVNSKNANVATGLDGVEHARQTCRALGDALGIAPHLVLPSSTGVIGVPLPIGKLLAACGEAPRHLRADRTGLETFARAIMTTDTRPKAISLRCGGATLSGVAKGAGMIEPHMATMLAYLFTDAQVPAAVLQRQLRAAVDASFNRISIDSDTSTSDTAVVLANGQAGPVDEAAFGAALREACVYLAREIARDGEGATKLIELHLRGAASPEAARALAKSVINSPLVKTAIHGADPNWGRFVMALGKVFAHPLRLEELCIDFGEPGADGPPMRITAQVPAAALLERISAYLRRPELRIVITVGHGPEEITVWGCDLTEGYVRENALYTT